MDNEFKGIKAVNTVVVRQTGVTLSINDRVVREKDDIEQSGVIISIEESKYGVDVRVLFDSGEELWVNGDELENE